MTDLQGKTIVLTGAASGLGRAWAEGFLAAGATVIAADIDAARLEAVAEKGARPLRVDVSDRSGVQGMIEYAFSETGRLDVLFNNAGVGFRTRIEDLTGDEFERTVAIHLFGTVHGMRFAIPLMRKQGHGRIVNTISRAAESGSAANSAYAAAKAAIWAATRSAVAEVADADILINMLIPGPTNTGIWGRDMPGLQPPEASFPTARMLATLPAGGPSGKVFWNEKEYPLFHPENSLEARMPR
jgi:3-oxoacyl-[acyl-carrier protein] reductase